MPSTFAAAMRLPFTWRSTSRMCSRSIASSGAGVGCCARGSGRPVARAPAEPALCLGPERAGQLALRQQRAFREHARALDDVLQLADVAVPARARSSTRSARRRQALNRLAHPRRALAHERGRQIRNVLAAIAQRRQDHLDDVEAVEQIAAEPAGGDLRAQIAIGGGDDGDVDAFAAAASRPAALRRTRARAAAWPAPTAAARRFRRETACRRARPRTRRPSIRPRR